MLQDVRDVSAFIEPLDESARFAACAFMELKRRNRFDQTVVETWNLVRRNGFKGAQADVARDDGRETPVVGAPECPDSRDLELGRVEFCVCFGSGGRQSVLGLLIVVAGKLAQEEKSGEGRSRALD
jgi:hypothetical protein